MGFDLIRVSIKIKNIIKYLINKKKTDGITNKDIENEFLHKIYNKNLITYINFEKINCFKKDNNRGYLIFCNHTSFLLDYLLIASKLNVYSITRFDIYSLFFTLMGFSESELLSTFQLINYKKNNYIDNEYSCKYCENVINIKNEILNNLNENKNILSYPEGEYSNYDSLKQFKKGSIYLAFDNDIPILPIYIDYKNDFYYKNSTMDHLSFYEKDNDGIDVNMLDFIYPNDYNSFDEFYNKIYSIMNDLHIKTKIKNNN